MQITVLLLAIIFSSFATTAIASSYGEIDNTAVTYYCILDGNHPGGSYCALRNVLYQGNIPSAKIQGSTMFSFGNSANTAFYTGTVSYPPYSLYGQQPANLSRYPFSRNQRYAFTIRARHVSLQQDGSVYVPIFWLPAQTAYDSKPSACKIIGGTVPTLIKKYPLTLTMHGSLVDRVTCQVGKSVVFKS